jgi:hypothetical protein
MVERGTFRSLRVGVWGELHTLESAGLSNLLQDRGPVDLLGIEADGVDLFSTRDTRANIEDVGQPIQGCFAYVISTDGNGPGLRFALSEGSGRKQTSGEEG